MPAQCDSGTNEPTKMDFLVPRKDVLLDVGSIIQNHHNQFDLAADSPNVEIVWKRARAFLPSLNDAHSIIEYPLRRGSGLSAPRMQR